MPDHTADYDPRMLPLTQKFYRNARPDYFDRNGEYRDHLRETENDKTWFARAVHLGVEPLTMK